MSVNNKKYVGISLVLLVVILLIQSFYLGKSSPEGVSLWQSPQRFFSTWITDLYLVLLFLFNYSFLAPWFVKRKSWVAYLLSVALATLIGMFLPIVLAQTLGWGTPYNEPNGVALSALGSLGAIAGIAIGLAVRSLKEWILVEEKIKKVEEENRKMKSELDALRNPEPSPLQANSTALEDKRGDQLFRN